MSISPKTVGVYSAFTLGPKKNLRKNCLMRDLKNLSLKEKKVVIVFIGLIDFL